MCTLENNLKLLFCLINWFMDHLLFKMKMEDYLRGSYAKSERKRHRTTLISTLIEKIPF